MRAPENSLPPQAFAAYMRERDVDEFERPPQETRYEILTLPPRAVKSSVRMLGESVETVVHQGIECCEACPEQTAPAVGAGATWLGNRVSGGRAPSLFSNIGRAIEAVVWYFSTTTKEEATESIRSSVGQVERVCDAAIHTSE